jgi:ABC-type Co2+ transport system permease subunit
VSQETGHIQKHEQAVGWTVRRNDMHIEPGLVSEAKLLLSYATASAALAFTAQRAALAVRETGVAALTLRASATTALVFGFFELLPHVPVGISEVHLILGSSLFLLFGAAPAAIGLAFGLFLQGVLFEPQDLPQYGMNVTTLLLPLFALQAVAARVLPKTRAYVDLDYAHVVKLSLAYQGGIVAWVAFWAIWGQGFGAENLAKIASFGLAYMTVVLVEPLIDLAVLALAKRAKHNLLFNARLHQPA